MGAWRVLIPSNRNAAVLVTVLALTTGCGSATSPTGPTSLPVTIQDVGGSRHLTESGGHTYAVWATVVTRTAVTGSGEVTVTLSGGAAPPQTYREPRVFAIPPGTGMLNFQIPDQASVAHTMAQVTMALNEGSSHPQATGSGALVDVVAPTLTASADRTALSAGETTTLRWHATGNGGVAVIVDPIAGVIFPAEGSTEITPCPGTTVFDLSTHNISGEAHVQVPITVGPPPRTPWFCGTWSGASTETWTDSAATPGSWSGGVALSGFQSGDRVTGYFLRTLQLNGQLVRPLDARTGPATGSLVATLPASAAGFPDEPGPRFACPIALEAQLTPDGAQLHGTFTAQCTPQPGREVTLHGQFDATRDSRPYPSSFGRQ
jgi:hypothetical protein